MALCQLIVRATRSSVDDEENVNREDAAGMEGHVRAGWIRGLRSGEIGTSAGSAVKTKDHGGDSKKLALSTELAARRRLSLLASGL